MPNWILGRTLTLIGILGAPFTGAVAKVPGAGDFASEREAREYLRQNPTGSRANAAFLALSEFRPSSENAGLSRDQIVDSFSNVKLAQATSGSVFRLPSETTAQDLY